MKKIILALILGVFLFQSTVDQVYAQASPTPSSAGSPLPDDRPDVVAIIGASGSAVGSWQPDAEVTFTGKLAVRSEDVLDWLLQNYQWAQFSGTETPFDRLFEFIRNTVFAVLGLFILVGAFLMIITRGRSLTVKRLIIRFVMVLVLVVFSFSIIRTIYSLTDIVQGFFLDLPNVDATGAQIAGEPETRIISTQDLLNVAFAYGPFKGFRRIGAEYNESAITSLLLIKATAATYYTMFIILIIRKIILWFFILVSPVFPLLLFFKQVRNTAKIWIGEFFRWVLYAPLFAIFLRGLVEIWKYGTGTNNATGVPLAFKTDLAGTLTTTGQVDYPTAINILLGGPGQMVLGNNNVNYRDTFVLYLVALLMLWMVIILPWILLRIFLDYFNGSSFGDSNLVKFLARNGLPPPGRYRPESAYNTPGSPTPPQSPPPGLAGIAKSLPLSKFRHTPVAEMQQVMQEEAAKAQQEIGQSVSQSMGQTFSQSVAEGGRVTTLNAQNANIQAGTLLASNLINISDTQSQQIVQALGEAGLSIPTMRDIARIEASSMQTSGPAKEEYNRLSEVLSRVGGTSQLVSPAEKQKFAQIKEQLVVQSKQGNVMAKSIVSAAAPTSVGGSALPTKNEVQQVNLEDYEEVKQTWEENYRKLDPPSGTDGKPKSRSEWLKEEIKQIPTVIESLMSSDPARQEQGKQMVATILPFLLLGGFSNTEIVSYLKAKLEAAKQVQKEVAQEEGTREEEDTKVEVDRTQHAEKTMVAHAEIPGSEDNGAGGSASTAASSGGDSGGFEDDEKSPISSALSSSPSGLAGAGSTTNVNQTQNEILQLTKLTIPTIKKIAEIETTILSGEGPAKEDIKTLNELVKGLSVEVPSDPATRATLIQVKEKLGASVNRGDAVAKSIQAAMMPMSQVKLPESNEIQQVSLDDYEEAKKTWAENFRKLEVPPSPDGSPRSREEWLKEEVNQIAKVIDSLLSNEPAQIEEGKKMVSRVLPFLLLGGFSKVEITAYLKAKLEAAKQVLLEMSGSEVNEEVGLDAGNKNQKTMANEMPLPPLGSVPEEKK